MRKVNVTIKERSGRVTKEMLEDVTEDFIITFFGLKEPDVQSYEIEECE